MAWHSLHDLMEQHTEQVGQALDKYKGQPVETRHQNKERVSDQPNYWRDIQAKQDAKRRERRG